MLDTTKPHYQIYGDVGYVGAKWEQAGFFYDKAGQFLGPGQEPEPPKPKHSKQARDNFPNKIMVKAKRRWEVLPQFEGLEYSDVQKMHIQTLRRIMIKNGQKYKGRAHALEYLK